MFPATMKMTALATPARPRRAAHAATSRVTGIAASVTTRTTPLTRRASRARLSVEQHDPEDGSDQVAEVVAGRERARLSGGEGAPAPP